MRLSAAIPLLILAGALSACSWERGARINVSGSVPQFVLTENARGGDPQAACVSSLLVERGGAAQWHIVAARTAQPPACIELSRITYGERPDGFMQVTAPASLEPDTPYRLAFETVGDYPNRGHQYFCFDAAGQVQRVAFASEGIRCRD